MTDAEKLATLVVEYLALADTAESSKDMDRIRKARAARQKLSAECKAILHPKQTQQPLFEEPPE